MNYPKILNFYSFRFANKVRRFRNLALNSFKTRTIIATAVGDIEVCVSCFMKPNKVSFVSSKTRKNEKQF